MSFTSTVATLVALTFGSSMGAPNSRIIGGQPADIFEFPYQISMRWTYGSATPLHFCGGSIISNNHILTAAHCVDDKRSPQMYRYVKIFTGSSRSDSAAGESHAVESVTVHPSYIGASNSYLNDVAIVKLKTPIEFNASQRAINLPTHEVRNGASAVVSGWGYTSSLRSQTSSMLQKATMQLISSGQCQSRLPFTLSYSQVCAIQRYGVGVCSGDSGGPLASNGEIVGIASYVVQCGKGYPDVYTNVYSHLNFIRQAIAAF